MTDDELMKRVREAQTLDDMISALRDRLARPQAEPVAWGLRKPDGAVDYDLVGTAEDCQYWARAADEPQHGWVPVPLYTHPAAPAVPLTDAQIEQIKAMPECWGHDGLRAPFRHHAFARAVEAAHGIGGKARPQGFDRTESINAGELREYGDD